MGRGRRRRGPHGQPGESDAGERELGEEMARSGEQGVQVELGQGEGPGHPRGSGRAAPQPGCWVEAEGGASPHRGWRGGCLRLLGGWGTPDGGLRPRSSSLGPEGRRPDIQVRLLPRLEGRLTAPRFPLIRSGLAVKPGGGCLKRISCLFDRNFQRHVLM